MDRGILHCLLLLVLCATLLMCLHACVTPTTPQIPPMPDQSRLPTPKPIAPPRPVPPPPLASLALLTPNAVIVPSNVPPVGSRTNHNVAIQGYGTLIALTDCANWLIQGATNANGPWTNILSSNGIYLYEDWATNGQQHFSRVWELR